MRRSRGCVWGFLRGCGLRTQLEELKGGQQGGSRRGNKGETHTHLHRHPNQSTGVAHLAFWVSPQATD